MNIVIGLGFGLVVGAVGMLVLARKAYRDVIDEYQQVAHRAVEQADRAIKTGNELAQELAKVNQRANLYEMLLIDTEVAYYRLGGYIAGNALDDTLEDIDDLLAEIRSEYNALLDGKTTGYVYTGDKEKDRALTEGYKFDVMGALDKYMNN
jgi:hypothetical protein